MSLAIVGLNPPVRISPVEPLSVEEFWRMAGDNPDLRMERDANGDVHIMTPTKPKTATRNGYITAMLYNWAETDGRGETFDSSGGFTLPDGSVLSPDASWASFDRLRSADPDNVTLPFCPNFLIELRSGSDRLPPLRRKMQLWIDNGAELGWLIDPQRKAVEIYRPAREPEIHEDAPSVQGEGPVAGFVLELQKVWRS